MSAIEIFTDGACSGNPGPAGIGVLIKREGQVVKELSKYIGEATNNIAEYTALVYALQEALLMRAEKIIIYTDSELVYKQISGNYKVKNEVLRPLFDQIKHMASGLSSFSVQHVRRELNKEADQLARKAVKIEQAKMVASPKTAISQKGSESLGSNPNWLTPKEVTESQMDFLSSTNGGEESPGSKG